MEKLDTRGILNPGAAGRLFQLERHAPCEQLAGLIERYWCVRWAFASDDFYRTEVLPFPSVNVAFEPIGGTVNGIVTHLDARELRGTGRVFGIKFKTGQFAPFFPRPIHTLTDRVLPFSLVFDGGAAVERAIFAEESDEARIRLFESFLLARLPAPDPERDRATAVVELARTTPGMYRVAQLCDAADLPLRTLQRLFRRYLGVTAKWTLCRFRIQEAAERVAQGVPVDWAQLAGELGYFDQSHFVSDFRAQVGCTPTAYIRRCGLPAAPLNPMLRRDTTAGCQRSCSPPPRPIAGS